MALIHIIPGKQFGAREVVTNAKLNQLGSPIGVFKVGGYRFGGVISREIELAVSDLGALTTASVVTYPVAFPGARTDAMYLLNVLNVDDMDKALEFTPYCTENETLQVRLRAVSNTDVTGDPPVEMRVTVFSPVKLEYGGAWSDPTSGSITMTPGYVFAPGERVTRVKLNQLGNPTGTAQANLIDVRSAEISVPVQTHSGGNWVTGDFAEYDIAFPGAVAEGTAWELETSSVLPRFFQSWIFCDAPDVVTIALSARSGATYASPFLLQATMFRFEV